MLDALQWVADWLAGLDSDQGMLSRAGVWLIKKSIVIWLQIKLEAFQIAWSVAKGVLTDLGVFSLIAAKWSALPADLLATLNFFKVPHGLNILLSAWATKFVMRVVPGL